MSKITPGYLLDLADDHDRGLSADAVAAGLRDASERIERLESAIITMDEKNGDLEETIATLKGLLKRALPAVADGIGDARSLGHDKRAERYSALAAEINAALKEKANG